MNAFMSFPGILLAIAFVAIPDLLLGIFGMTEPLVTTIGKELLGYLSVSGLFVTVALSYTGGLQGTGDTRSPLYISIISQIVVPIGLCFILQATRGLHASDIWLAIVLGQTTDGMPPNWAQTRLSVRATTRLRSCRE